MKTFYHKTEQRIVKSFDNPDSNIWSEEPIPISSSKSQPDNSQVDKQDSLSQNVTEPVNNSVLSTTELVGEEETQTSENLKDLE